MADDSNVFYFFTPIIVGRLILLPYPVVCYSPIHMIHIYMSPRELSFEEFRPQLNVYSISSLFS